MEEFFASLEKARRAVEEARRIYETVKGGIDKLSEDDQAKLKTHLAELQVEYDAVHADTQALLRGN